MSNTNTLSATKLTAVIQESLAPDDVRRTADEYLGLYDESKGGNAAARKSNYTTLVNDYYDLVTDFYEFGWGQSFHFAPRHTPCSPTCRLLSGLAAGL